MSASRVLSEVEPSAGKLGCSCCKAAGHTWPLHMCKELFRAGQSLHAPAIQMRRARALTQCQHVGLVKNGVCKISSCKGATARGAMIKQHVRAGMQYRRHAAHSMVQRVMKKAPPSYREGTTAAEGWVREGGTELRPRPRLDHSNQRGSQERGGVGKGGTRGYQCQGSKAPQPWHFCGASSGARGKRAGSGRAWGSIPGKCRLLPSHMVQHPAQPSLACLRSADT